MLWLLAIVAAVAAMGDEPPSVVAGSRVFVPPATPATPATVAPKLNRVSQETGWEPAWLRSGKTNTLEWGFCPFDLRGVQEGAGIFDEGKFERYIEATLGKAKARTVLTLAVCARVEIPAATVELADGRSFWMPCRPQGGGPGEIVGWAPGSTRPGFSASVAAWPLGDVPPGEIGGVWLRNLGDFWGWGALGYPVEVYQFISRAAGVLMSWPAMSREAWRTGMKLMGETSGGEEIYPGGMVQWLRDWRCSGQDYKRHAGVSRTIAMNRFS